VTEEEVEWGYCEDAMVALISRDISDGLPVGSMRKRVSFYRTVSLIHCTYSEASKDKIPPMEGETTYESP
jgi:hypothetical protein